MGTIRDFIAKGGKLPGAEGFKGGSSTVVGTIPGSGLQKGKTLIIRDRTGSNATSGTTTGTDPVNINGTLVSRDELADRLEAILEGRANPLSFELPANIDVNDPSIQAGFGTPDNPKPIIIPALDDGTFLDAFNERNPQPSFFGGFGGGDSDGGIFGDLKNSALLIGGGVVLALLLNKR